MKSRPFFLWIMPVVCLVIAVGSVPRSLAGNKKMVEERVRELDEMNKQVVRQIPDLPKDGTIYLKGKASYKEGEIRFDATDKQIVTPDGAVHQSVGGEADPDAAVERSADVEDSNIDLGEPVKANPSEGEREENEPETK